MGSLQISTIFLPLTFIAGVYRGREAHGAELEPYWPHLVALWPAYQQHCARSGQRSIFVLEPIGQDRQPGHAA
jgi:hypothetical protein